MDEPLVRLGQDFHSSDSSLDGTPPKQKVGSLTTIFSLWNTMIGSSMLAMPWAFQQAGVVGGVSAMVLMASVDCYTAGLFVKHRKHYINVLDLTQEYFGVVGKTLAFLASFLVMTAAVMSYAVLMADSLYQAVNGFRQLADPSSLAPDVGIWSRNACCVGIFVIIFPLCNLNSPTLFLRLNSLGIVSVLYLIGFVVIQCAEQFPPVAAVPMGFEIGGTARTAALLSLSFFSHNFVLEIVQNQAVPENNRRDLIIAYISVAICYTLVGLFGCLAYGGETIEQDFLKQFNSTLAGALVARILLVFQLFTVWPIVVYITRLQTCQYLWQVDHSGIWRVGIINLIICGSATCVSLWYPNIGDVLAYAGASCGLIYVFLLPICVHLKRTYFAQEVRGTCFYPSVFFHTILFLFGVALLVATLLPK